MFWDKAAALYDLFENIYNGKVYAQIWRRAAEFVSRRDNVLECACGMGAISAAVAEKCNFLTATDYSDGMLRRAKKKLAHRKNVKLEKTDIMRLSYADNTFDKVVAGNIIHLLPAGGNLKGVRARLQAGRVADYSYIYRYFGGYRQTDGAAFGAARAEIQPPV